MNRVDISIIVATFNHEHYIEKAIESILRQKGTYSYEVLIGEDKSTDGTRRILKKAEKKLPKEFHVFYREKNMGINDNFDDLFKRAIGRYIIVLEGDDFWTYDYKLQREFEFLESHPEYIAVAHNTYVVDKNDKCINENYPECQDNEYKIKDFLKGILPGQTTTIMCRNYYFDKLFDINLAKSDYPRDRKRAFLLVFNGRVACMQHKWSAYRHVVSEGDSYSARMARREAAGIVDYHNPRLFFRSIYKYALKHPVNGKKVKIIEQTYFKRLIAYAEHNQDGVTMLSYLKELRQAQYPLRSWIRFFPAAWRRLCRICRIKMGLYHS